MRILLFTAVVACSTPAIAQDRPCTTSAAQVVDDIFQHVLERPADQGSAGLTEALATGRMSVREITAAVSSSSEYEARFFWPPIVAAIYRQGLQRMPTDVELRNAVSSLASGQGDIPALVAFVTARAANDDADAVRMVYRRLLRREPDAEGYRAYTALAQREGLDAVTQSIVNSREYRSRAGEDLQAYEPAVRELYRHVLGRAADTEGLRALSGLAAVYGPDAVVERMTASVEYRQRYGENGVPGRNVMFCGGSPDRRTTVPRR